MRFDAGLHPNYITSFYISVDSHATKKNNRPIFKNRKSGKVFLGKSTKLKSAESEILSQLEHQAFVKKISTISDLVWVVFIFHFPRHIYFTKKGQINKKLPDLSNLYQLPEDLLQKSGIIANDSQISSHDYSRRIPGDKYLLEIHLLKHEDTPC